MEDIVSYQFTKVRQRRDERQEIQYELILRQQPKQSRMCGIGEKADRRPIDPPPIIQLKVYDASLPQSEKSSFLQNPYFFMYASLVAPDTDEELHLLRDGKTRSTTGSVVSSLYHLKDIDNSDAGFFVFPDLSVRMEGTYRLKLSLFEIIGREVYHCKSIFSDIFIVYSAKRFPGMEESTFLSRSFADQGLKIRIRKEIRIRRRLAKRDRKELELIDHSRLKRPRPDGKRDDDSGESSDADLHTPTADDTRSKLSPEIIHSSYDKRKDHTSISPSSPRRMYEHMPPHIPHYDPNTPMYGPGPGYPPHRPHSWHDRPDYMTDPHYSPYYDPYDRRYGYHPYYYPHPPPPIPDGSDHHRYPYPAYGRPPMYPGQPAPGYYDTPPRVGHPPSDSPGSVRPYGYDPSGSYPPQRAPWPHYGERSQSRDPNLEPSSSQYRGSAPVTPPPPRGHPIYPYSDYYAPYAHPPIPPPPKTAEYAPVPPIDTSGDPNNPQSKIPIQNLFATAPPAPHPSRMYGAPPSAFAHIYPHPARPHEYMRHDLYGRPPYDVGYPPRDVVSPYGTPSSSAAIKSPPVSQSSHSQQGDTARTALMLPPTSTPMTPSSTEKSRHNIDYNNPYERRSTFSGEPLASTSNPSATPATNPSSTSSSQASSSYSGMPIIPTATRTTVTLPSLVPLTLSDRNERFVASSSSPAYHSVTSAPPLHTTTPSSQQINSPQSQTPKQSYEHPYSHSASNSQNRGTFGMTSSSDGNGGNNSSKNNGVKPNLSSGSNEKSSPRAAGFEGNYPLRRQGGDAEGERNVNESVGGGGGKY